MEVVTSNHSQIIASLEEDPENSTATGILKWAFGSFPSALIFTTSFGAEDQILTDLIHRSGLAIEIVTLDTGRLFDETYEIWEVTEKLYGIKIRSYFPDHLLIEQYTHAHGINAFRQSIDNRRNCCAIRKLEPLQRALNQKKAWITGLRREQSVTRETLKPLEWDAVNSIFKINPLYQWDETDVWDYIRAWNVPYNRLHDKGYPSIGCAPCTRPVRRTENVREGRWWWEAPEHKECGLHKRPRQ